MNGVSVLAVGAGAALGAWCRWGLGELLNTFLPLLPLGTLAANLTGALLIGLMAEAVARHGGVSTELQLFVITGFLGAMTTFSTFSAEMVILLRRAQYFWFVAGVGAHLLGSLAMTVMGMAAARWLFR